MLKIGIVGTNFVSGWMAEAIRMTPGVEAAAVCSRKQETGEAFAGANGGMEVFTDFEEFIHSELVDAVYIASPNVAHCRQAVVAMDAGKHVLCEKVIATNLKEFDQMKEAAFRNRVVLMEAVRPVHDPACGLLLSHMGEIGPVRRATIEYCQYSSRYDKFKEGTILNAFNPEFSNAAIMDIGVYCVHFCTRLFGMPEKIHAESSFLHNGMEGSGILLLDYGTMQAEIVYSKITESVFPSVIQGEDGTLTVDKLSVPTCVMKYDRKNGPSRLPYDPSPNNMVYELADFRDLVEENRYDHEYLPYSEMTMKILDEARRQTGIVFPAER